MLCVNSAAVSEGVGGSYSGGCSSGGGADADLAEYYDTEGERPERGDLLALTGHTRSMAIEIANRAPGEKPGATYDSNYSTAAKAAATDRERLVGAVPSSPGFVLDAPYKDKMKQPQILALSGHVPVRMTLDGGDIAVGDPITVSTSTPGAGMKATTSGRIVGYALAPFSATQRPKGGMVEVMVHMEDWIAPQDRASAVDLRQQKTVSDNLVAQHAADAKAIDELRAEMAKVKRQLPIPEIAGGP